MGYTLVTSQIAMENGGKWWKMVENGSLMDDFRIKPGYFHLFAAVCRSIDGPFLVDLPIQNCDFL